MSHLPPLFDRIDKNFSKLVLYLFTLTDKSLFHFFQYCASLCFFLFISRFSSSSLSLDIINRGSHSLYEELVRDNSLVLYSGIGNDREPPGSTFLLGDTSS